MEYRGQPDVIRSGTDEALGEIVSRVAVVGELAHRVQDIELRVEHRDKSQSK